MYRVVQTETFLSSLLGCASYIKNDLKNAVAASRLLDKAEAAGVSLAEMPHRFPFSRYKSLADKGIRILPINNHCIFYSVDDSTQIVYLHLFGYSPRNWDQLF